MGRKNTQINEKIKRKAIDVGRKYIDKKMTEK